jgi:hypothetical protein
VKRWPLDPAQRKFLEGKSVRAGIPGLLPRGFHYLPFLQDINRDGVGDVVVPGAATFHVYLLKGDGSASGELEVPEKLEIRSRLRAVNLGDRVGQSVSIPLFELRDVNSDGRVDLVSRTEDRLEVFLAAGDGTYPRSPSYVLDLAAARAQLGEFSPDDLDWSNLTGAFTRTVQAKSADVNGDGVEDVVLRAGGKVSLFIGSNQGLLDTSHPSQVLKSSGNVVFAALEDEDGDRRPDLWLVRLEAIGVGDVFLWLISSGKLGIDFFIYRNGGERFASRPSRRLEVTVRFPSVVSILGQLDELENYFENKSAVLRRSGDLQGLGEGRDAVVLEKGRLQAFLGKVQSPSVKGGLNLLSILRFLGYRPDQDRYDLDFTNLKEFVSRLEGQAPLRDPQGPADLEIPLAGASSAPGLWLLDLNGDRRDDFLLVYEHTPAGLRGAILLSRVSAGGEEAGVPKSRS